MCKKTTEEEREVNKEKGCVKPADGTPKKCLINVVNCKEGDVTRRENSIIYNNTNINCLITEFFNWKNWVMPFMILTILFTIFYKYKIFNIISSKIK